ncbi:hypothetical protein DL98DRAFT_409702 [Cadophora sp. DSE1049]|nr:hypothetical protein DL98DRAFT_409702 [Cadophora sp. DSE1049]
MIKQIACGRRKPNMTRKEYNDHRFQVHGRITDGPDRSCCPTKYIQTPIFDAAFGKRAGDNPPNCNHSWVGRDDITELYFTDVDHLKHVFNSEYVRNTIGPDGLLFADFETTIVLMAREMTVELSSVAEGSYPEEGYGTTASYFLSPASGDRNGEGLRTMVEPLFVKSLSQYTSGEVYRVYANVGYTSAEFDLNAYFGGGNMPQFSLVYKLYMKDVKSVPAIRRAQKAFESQAADLVNFVDSFIVFGKEGLVMDYSRNILFDPARQPVFDEVDYQTAQSHLVQ